jgi:hypothetical protein
MKLKNWRNVFGRCSITSACSGNWETNCYYVSTASLVLKSEREGNIKLLAYFPVNDQIQALLTQRPQWSLPKIGKKQNIEKGFTSSRGNYKKTKQTIENNE